MADAFTEYGEGTVITGTGGSSVFIPMTRWIPALNVLQLRATLELRGLSASGVIVTAAFQTSNDMVNLDAAVSFGSGARNEGFQYPSGYTDISANTAGKRFIRFGLACQYSLTGIQSCWAAIAVDILSLTTNFASFVSYVGPQTTVPPAITWNAPSFVNSWVNYGGVLQTVGYYKDAMGWVHLRGSAKGGASGTTVFNLPAGFRPSATLYYLIVGGTGAGYTGIDSSGNVSANNFTGSNVNSQAAYDGITFYAEQ